MAHRANKKTKATTANSSSSLTSIASSNLSTVNCILNKSTAIPCCQQQKKQPQSFDTHDQVNEDAISKHQHRNNNASSIKRAFFKNLKALSSSLSHSSSFESTNFHAAASALAIGDETSFVENVKNLNNKKQRDAKFTDKVIPRKPKSTASLLSVNWSNLDYDEDDFAEAFRVFDKNGDGRITAQELGQVLKELGIVLKSDDIKLMIAELDKDGNGTIEYSEFVQMMTQPASRDADEFELREAFKCIDLDGNGFISRDELRKAVRKIMSTDKKISVQDVEEMMIEADQDGNGLIDFDGNLIYFILFF